MCFYEWPLPRWASGAPHRRRKGPGAFRRSHRGARPCAFGHTSVNGASVKCPMLTGRQTSQHLVQNSQGLGPARPGHQTPFLFLCNPYSTLVPNPSRLTGLEPTRAPGPWWTAAGCKPNLSSFVTPSPQRSLPRATPIPRAAVGSTAALVFAILGRRSPVHRSSLDIPLCRQDTSADP